MSNNSSDTTYNFENNIIFLLKLRKFFPIGRTFQFLFLMTKYLPIFLLAHDMNINMLSLDLSQSPLQSKITDTFSTKNHINSFLSLLTLTRIFRLQSSSLFLQVFLYFILLCFLILFINLRIFYAFILKKTNSLSDSKMKKSFPIIISSFSLIFILFNQNIYEVLFSFFICEPGENTQALKNNVLLSLNTDCYSIYRNFLITISILISFSLMIFSLFFNFIFFQPWFSSNCLIPNRFNGNNWFWTLTPILQGYLVLEPSIPDQIRLIIRIVLRCIYLFYSLNFFYKIHGLIYVTKFFFHILIFFNAFNCTSIILEFIPFIGHRLFDIKFVIIKIIFQSVIGLFLVVFIQKREEKILHNMGNKKRLYMFYELYNRYLFLLINLDRAGQGVEENLEIIVNQFFENKLIRAKNDVYVNDQNYHHNLNSNRELIEVYKKAKSFFEVVKKSSSEDNSQLLSREETVMSQASAYSVKSYKAEHRQQRIAQNTKHKLIITKLNFYINWLDEIFLQIIQDERGPEMTRYKNILLYCLFCNSVKKNHISAFFYLEKLNKTKIYQESFLMRLYYAQIKKYICRDHYKYRVQESKDKVNLFKFFNNIKDFDRLTTNLRISTESLRDLILKINTDNMNMKDFTDLMTIVWHKLQINSIKSNSNLRGVLFNLINNSENNSIIPKFRIFNDMVFKENDFFKDQHLFPVLSRISPKIKDTHSELYMICHLDENENIIVSKIEKKLLTHLQYDSQDLIDKDLLFLIPSKISRYHKKKTTFFTRSNKDFRKLDVFFITRTKYAYPVRMKAIIFPIFDNRILFFTMFEPLNKDIDMSIPSGSSLNVMNLGPNLMTQNLSQFNNGTIIHQVQATINQIDPQFTCFLELNNQCEIVSFNREFEIVFGLNREVIDSPSGKFNFLHRVLRLQPDKIFNRFDNLQHYEAKLPFIQVFENFRNLNYEEFKEYALESFYKFRRYLNSFNLKKFQNSFLNIFIERRIIDPIDKDFFYVVNMTHIENSKEKKKKGANGQSIDSNSESGVNNHVYQIDTIFAKKEKKNLLIIQEIYQMSKNMLKESSRLWRGRMKYSEITDYTDESKITNLGSSDITKIIDPTHPQFAGLGNYFSSAINTQFEQFGQSDYNTATKSFEYKKFIYFLILSLILVVFYIVFINFLFSEYEDAIDIYKISEKIINIKYSQIMTTFSLLEYYIKTNNIFFPEKNIYNSNVYTNFLNYIKTNTFSEENLIKTHFQTEEYIDNLNQDLYEFTNTFSKINNDRYFKQNIYNLLDNTEVYKTIHYDFSIYKRKFSFYDAILNFRSKVANLDKFDNLTFYNTGQQSTSTSTDVFMSGKFYDMNKLKFMHTTRDVNSETSLNQQEINLASQGDLLIYYLINNFIDKTIPLSDKILLENRNSLQNFLTHLKNFEIIFIAIILFFLSAITFLLYDYFYTGKKYIYERYFVMFNIMRFFTPYIMPKIKSYEDLLTNYTKESFDFFQKLDYDLATDNINCSLIRFDLENNNLIVFSTAKNRKLEKYLQNYANANSSNQTSYLNTPGGTSGTLQTYKRSNNPVTTAMVTSSKMISNQNNHNENFPPPIRRTSLWGYTNTFFKASNVNIDNENDSSSKNVFSQYRHSNNHVQFSDDEKISYGAPRDPNRRPSKKFLPPFKSGMDNGSIITSVNKSTSKFLNTITKGENNENDNLESKASIDYIDRDKYKFINQMISEEGDNKNKNNNNIEKYSLSFKNKKMIFGGTAGGNELNQINEQNNNNYYENHQNLASYVSSAVSSGVFNSTKNLSNLSKINPNQNKHVNNQGSHGHGHGHGLKLKSNKDKISKKDSKDSKKEKEEENHTHTQNTLSTTNSRLASRNMLLPHDTEANTNSTHYNNHKNHHHDHNYDSKLSRTNTNTDDPHNSRKSKLDIFNDANINPKNLLKAKSSFYFDFYFLFTILILFFLVNLIFFSIMYNYTNEVMKLNDYTVMSVNLAYSQIEISLIYIITLMRRREIKENLSFSNTSTSKSSVFDKKIENFINDKNNLTLSRMIIEGISDYEDKLLNENACETIVTQYETFKSKSTPSDLTPSIEACLKISGGIYKKGLILGFESLINNLVNTYNEKLKLNFNLPSDNLYDESLFIILNSRREVLEKNIYNTKEIIRTGTDKIFENNKRYMNLYYLLFFMLCFLLVLSYCFVYLFTKRSYTLLTRMERVLVNLLK
jgi:hypothetical protein